MLINSQEGFIQNLERLILSYKLIIIFTIITLILLAIFANYIFFSSKDSENLVDNSNYVIGMELNIGSMDYLYSVLTYDNSTVEEFNSKFEENIFKYTIKEGETLSSIANKFNISVLDLIAYNNFDNPNLLFPGTEIYVSNKPVKSKVTISSIDSVNNEYLYYDLRTPSDLNPEDINNFLAGTNLAGLGEVFIEAEYKYNVNAKYLMAHAIHESDWGNSKIAQDKNNLFGFKAYDSSPYQSAMVYESFEESIDYTANFIANYYLDIDGKYYNGPTLVGMNKNYATDNNWANLIADIMIYFDKKNQ